MTDWEYDEMLDNDSCSYEARSRRARINGWPDDIKSLEKQYCYNGTWWDSKLKERRERDKELEDRNK